MKQISKLALIVAAIGATVLLPAAASAAPVVTDKGAVQGVASNGVEAFRGIPFAAPPVGELRWKSPEPAAAWSGVKLADKNAPACLQDMGMLVAMGEAPLPVSEDCLYLNVWKPANLTGPAPVMVWIHGGGFTTGGTGAGLFDGAALARKGVIVVTLSYRLGALGFLATSDLDSGSKSGQSGNFGIEDQIAGLKWVKANIAAFGGDPNNITIFGESAGAMSVSILAGSPATGGLFNKVISQSGGGFAVGRTGTEGGLPLWAPTGAETYGSNFLKHLNVTSVAQARQLPAEDILKASTGPFGAWAPVRDGQIISIDPVGNYQSGKFNHTPVLIGANNDEGLLFVQKIDVAGFRGMVTNGYGDKASEILAAYPNDTDEAALKSARSLFAQTIFVWPTWTWANLQAKSGVAPVFMYYNSHVPPLPPAPMFKGAKAFHGSELAFVWGNPGHSAWSDSDRKFSDTVMTYWVNFARTGNPNGEGLPTWPAFTPGQPSVMNLDNTSSVIDLPDQGQLTALSHYYDWRRQQAIGQGNK